MLWILLIAVAFPGHVALCLYVSNYLNAVVVNRRLKHALSMPVEGFLAIGPCAITAAIVLGHWRLEDPSVWNAWQWAVAGYLLISAAVGILFVPRWLHRQVTGRPPALLLSNHTTAIDLRPQLSATQIAAGLGRVYLRVPGNESLCLAIHEKTIAVPRLPAALHGLTIAHLSDLHFTGRIGKAYFDEVVQLTNDLAADLVAITGDLVDSPRCLDWLPDTLGRLSAPQRVYFVLGNHDLRAGAQRVRSILAECGLIDLSGRWLRCEIRGQGVILAGNELPWFSPAADMNDCPAPGGEGRDFRILLSHSPDQWPWALRREIDLMLAGHTHGGQIRFPVIGPILAPSRYGVRYAAGTFDLSPMVMHVSRGISGLQPLRFNCPPELTKLVLKCASAAEPGV